MDRFVIKKEAIAPIKSVRRVDNSDLESITKLINNTVKDYFGKEINVPKIVEQSFLSLCLVNSSDKIVAAICLKPFPNILSIPSWDWLPWIKNLYETETLTSRNTLFIHLMVWDGRYKSDFMEPILAAVFYQFLYIHHILLIAPPGVPALFFVEEFFTRLLPKGYSDCKKVQTIYITLRQRHVTRYKIRRAVEEDNDDLVPLLQEHTTRLAELYGEFYISEIIQHHSDSQRQFIVAEENEQAVGILGLTTNIDYDTLNACFELAPFHGLKKPHPDDSEGTVSSPSLLDLQHKYQDDELSNLPDSSGKNTNKVSSTSVKSYQNNKTDIASICSDKLSSSSSSDDIEIVDSVPSFHMNDNDSQTSYKSTASMFSCVVLTNDDVKADKFHENRLEEDRLRAQRLKLLQRCKDMKHFLPSYLGQDNAFAIELFSSHPTNEKAVAADLLEAAFECYPERDYCIMSVPSTYPPWPLMQPFVRIAPRPYATFPHEIYLLHRNSMLSQLEVRMATSSDITAFKNLSHGVTKGEDITNDFISSVTDFESPLRSYLLLSEECVVGCVILREEDEYDYLSSHYNVNKFIGLQHYTVGSFGLLVHALVSPIFQTHKRFFLREIHRLSDLPVMHYCMYPNDAKQFERPLANIVAEMIAVSPRLRPEYHPDVEKDGDVPMDFVLREDPPYALYVITPRHASNPKMDVNRKLVIVGASTTGLSFLEHFVFGSTASYISFTNITIVSPHGLAHSKPPLKARDLLFPADGRYSFRHMRQISIQCYVNLVPGVMTAINRKDKYITINEEYILPYDYLFLTCGEQYQQPKVHEPRTDIYENQFPENVFIVNTEIDGENALFCLKNIIGTQKYYTVIVYGATLEAYCCLSALQSFGVPGSNITFVEPYPALKNNDNVSLFNDSEVDDAIADVLQKEKIVVHTSFYFSHWTWCSGEPKIRSVVFESKFRQLEVECIAMFFYEEKAVSTKTLSAINRAGLVYDGHLVIDPLYHTNDPNILAAGSMTKYSRRYYADHLSHKYFNKIEIGRNLASYAHSILDPTLLASRETPSSIDLRKVLTPLFKDPIVSYCTLPSGLNYLKITKPGKPVAYEAEMKKDDYGSVFVTGNSKSLDQGYFRLHINKLNIVETITCLTRRVVDVQNMIKIWCKHTTLLNDLIVRFNLELIPDLFDYFRQPWIYALYHESYHDKVEIVNKKILRGEHLGFDRTLLQKIEAIFEKNQWNEMTPEQRQEVFVEFQQSPQQLALMKTLLDFLVEYDMHLPVYAHPMKVKLVIGSIESSPLHCTP